MKRQRAFSFAFLILLALTLTFIYPFRARAATEPSGGSYTSQGPALTIIQDGFWHITYDEDDVASCRFYKMPIHSPRGASFTYARDQWVCEPYETRTLWYFVGDDEYLVEGWQKIDGVWYYFEERTGRMYADEITPDGYYVGPDGALAG